MKLTSEVNQAAVPDNYTDFRADGNIYSYSGNDGTNAAVYDTSSYKLLNNNTQLEWTIPGIVTNVYDIKTLTLDSMVLFSQETNSGITSSVTLTFKK
jgi:hypothetical protein